MLRLSLRGADTRVCGVETRLDALRWLPNDFGTKHRDESRCLRHPCDASPELAEPAAWRIPEGNMAGHRQLDLGALRRAAKDVKLGSHTICPLTHS
jgi:hypothetical protein